MEADMFQFMLPAASAHHDDHDLKFWHVPSHHTAVTQQTAFRPSTCSRKSLLSWSSSSSSSGRCLGRESRVGELGLGQQQLRPALHGDMATLQSCMERWRQGHGRTWHPQYMTPYTCPEEAGNAILPHTALHLCPIRLACFLTGPKKTFNLWYLRLLPFLMRGHCLYPPT